MSKELEALRVLKANAILFDDGTDFGASMLEAISELDKYLTPPTADEVCKALSEYLPVDNGYHYDKEYKWFTRRSGVIIWLMPNRELNISIHLPPHLVTLIGRFYEAQQ